MAKLPIFSARSYDNLCDHLSKINLSAQPRGQAGSKDHRETWSICRFLATYGDTRFIEYPLEVEHDNRPDFRLFMPTVSVGVEVTDTVDQQRAHHDAIANRCKSTGLQDASLFRYGHREYSNEELHRMAEQPVTKLEGPGLRGDEIEQGWAKAIIDRIKVKTSNFYKEGFEKFEKNWLIIYDITVEPEYLIDDPANYLKKEINHIKEEDPQIPFDYIFVERNRYFLKIGEKISQDKIVDLWN